MRPIHVPGKRSVKQSMARSGVHGPGIGPEIETGFRAGKRQLMTAAALTTCLILTACAGGQIEELEAQLATERAAAEEARSQAEQAAQAAETAQRAAEQAQRERVEAVERLELEREELARTERRVLEQAQQQAEQQAREAAVQRSQREAAARAQQQQQEQRARLASMEDELAAMQQRIRGREQANVQLREAITAAEELLQMLDSEQQKYDNLDASGQTVEPLQQGLIAELEARKNALIREAEELTRQSQ